MSGNSKCLNANVHAVLCVVALCPLILCGCQSQKAPQSAAGRFVPTGSDATVALDTKTGRLCRTTANAGNHADLPLCSEGQGQKGEHAGSEGDAGRVDQVSVDPKVFDNAEIAVTCSGKEHFLPMYPMNAQGRKEVTLNCNIKNLTGHTVPLPAPAKVDALFRLHNGQVIRVPHVYLGSQQHEIPARGEIRDAGLFLGHDRNCPADQSDYDCAQTELMNSDELLLTDTSNGVRYHVRVEQHPI